MWNSVELLALLRVPCLLFRTRSNSLKQGTQGSIFFVVPSWHWTLEVLRLRGDVSHFQGAQSALPCGLCVECLKKMGFRSPLEACLSPAVRLCLLFGVVPHCFADCHYLGDPGSLPHCSSKKCVCGNSWKLLILRKGHAGSRRPREDALQRSDVIRSLRQTVKDGPVTNASSKTKYEFSFSILGRGVWKFSKTFYSQGTL
jgi:hypothetical protein